ncbi:hypothetical protein ASE25_10555 [Terrabacter sp. Root85]|nr:hypothetical protein ASE25_10555 [Terrabacter sp. Root85]
MMRFHDVRSLWQRRSGSGVGKEHGGCLSCGSPRADSRGSDWDQAVLAKGHPLKVVTAADQQLAPMTGDVVDRV